MLLTTGGYSANPAMLSALSPITTASVTALGYNQNNEGMGIKAALWAVSYTHLEVYKRQSMGMPA